MKALKSTIFLFGILLVTSGFSFSCQESAKKKETTEVKKEETIQKARLTVYGMTCTGCENAIEKKVKSLAGILSIEATHTDSTTIVIFDASLTNIDSIKKTIEDTGYEVKKTTLLE